MYGNRLCIRAKKKETMSNIDAIIAQVNSDLDKYSDAGLLDENKMYSDAVRALKRFGNDVALLQEVVLEVKNGQAILPEQFFSLYAAFLCEPLYYKENNVEVHDLQNSIMYRERVMLGNQWSDCESCCETKTENVITENVYFKSGSVSFYYHQPRLLRLGKTFKKELCHSKCRNKIVSDNPEEIVIIGDVLQANFNEGSIYMQYYGLPVDEDGHIDIPDTKNGHLFTYIEYHLKRRIAEKLIGNNDAQGLQNLYPVYKQEEQTALRNASSELKLSKLTPQSFQRMQRLNRMEMLNFEINAPVWL